MSTLDKVREEHNRIVEGVRDGSIPSHTFETFEDYMDWLHPKDVYVAYYNEGEGDSHLAYFYDIEKAKDYVDMQVLDTLDLIKYDVITETILASWYNSYNVEKIKIE
jgi:hypothetical protein